MTDIEKVLEAIERIDKKLDAWIKKYELDGFIPEHDPYILPTMPTYDIDPNSEHDAGMQEMMDDWKWDNN